VNISGANQLIRTNTSISILGHMMLIQGGTRESEGDLRKSDYSGRLM
jgi:hypothetical protein